MMSKTAIGVAVGLGTLFVGYCIYFDRKRRSDPNYKRKVKERRRLYKLKNRESTGSRSQIPDLKDHEQVQMFFLQEVQLGEELLGQNDIDGAVEHLGNAVAVCGQPNQLLKVLQQTLPPAVFNRLIQHLPQVSQRIMSQAINPADQPFEDDVE